MTGEDIFKIVIGSIVTTVTGAVAWLISKVLGNREELLVQKQRLMALEKESDDLKKAMLTQDHVRTAIEQALDRRDLVAADRRREWDERTKLEIKQTVAVEIERMIPRLVREVRTATGQFRRGSDESSEG